MANLEKTQHILSNIKTLMSSDEIALNVNDKHAIQQVYNIEHYLLSNANYDARHELNIIRQLIENCNPALVEHLNPLLLDM